MTHVKKNTAVIFDTNSYRQLTLNKSKSEIKTLIKKIKKSELKKNIEAYCIYIVAHELIANLAEGKEGPNYNNCLQSLIFLSNHCHSQKLKTIWFIPPPYFHMANIIFGKVAREFKDETKKISKFINSFRIYNGLPPTEKYNEKIYEFLKQSVHKEESDFSHKIMNLINIAKSTVEDKNPKSTPKHIKVKLLEYLKSEKHGQILSILMVRELAADLKINLTETTLFRIATQLRTAFHFAVGFFQWIMHEIVSKNIDMQSNKSKNKRWNWLWDYQICFLITDKHHHINNRNVMLVTSDKDIIAMIKENGFNNKVFTISQYLDYLES